MTGPHPGELPQWAVVCLRGHRPSACDGHYRYTYISLIKELAMQCLYRWALGAFIVILAVPLTCLAQIEGEREVQLEPSRTQGGLFDTLGLSRPELGGLRLSAFLVGSFSYNSHIQMVPEFAGGIPALADAGATNFRFDKFGLRVAKTFASWLSASGSFEVESHRDRHSHGFDPAFGCPGAGPCVERFGAEEATTETNLDLFQVTAVAPSVTAWRSRWDALMCRLVSSATMSHCC